MYSYVFSIVASDISYYNSRKSQRNSHLENMLHYHPLFLFVQKIPPHSHSLISINSRHPRLTFSPKEAGNVLCHPSVPFDLNRGFIIERDRKGRSKSNYLHDLRGVSLHDGRCS